MGITQTYIANSTLLVALEPIWEDRRTFGTNAVIHKPSGQRYSQKRSRECHFGQLCNRLCFHVLGLF